MGFEIVPPRAPIASEGGFITNEWYRFLVQVQRITGSGLIETILDAPYLTFDPSTGLTNAKTLLAGTALSLVETASDATINLDDTAVVPDTYGGASSIPSITVDQQGRVTAASASLLDSDNMTEGVTNLFYTDARARAAISASTGLSYNSATGAMSLADTAVGPGSYGSASQVATFTVDAQGRLTAAANAAISIGAAAVSGVALTKTDDTNVTLTLGGSPSTALVAAASLTLGWTGTLSVARGGTGGGVASGTLLDNISGFASTGQMVRTGAGAYAFRTAIGTANRIDVTNGSGVSGNPTFDISASYVGQASITTLGTITTGVWNGTTIAVANGGTGATSMTANALPKGNGTSAYTASNVSDDGNLVSIASGKGFSIARTGITSPTANDGNVYSGTYTPTLTGVTNIDAVTANVCQYMRVGNVVTVSGMIGVDATATGNYTFRASLPIASNFTSASQCNGSLTASGGLGYSRIVADTVNDVAQFDGNTSSTASNNSSFTFTYLVA